MPAKRLIYAPSISQVPDKVTRPLWSVMIPTYNGMAYLGQTLRSVLEQAPDPSKMQIEVIDDCSTQGNPEALIKEVGQGRISFFRNPKNVGLVNNWNTCIQRAHGFWVHILHQDDLVLPGFYEHLEKATKANSLVGAAFCRHTLMDEDSHWQALSPIERKEPGILHEWIQKIAVQQVIQFPSIVVKRSVYEDLGGFCPEVHYAADWEMWQRIAAHYQVWFEPQVLASYRQHSGSETSRLVKSGSDIADIRKAIEMATAYLPSAEAKKLSSQAKEHYALHALNTAKKILAQHDFAAASIQIKEALHCSRSFKVIHTLLRLFGSFAKNQLLHHSPQR